jgi:hypothetical protein
MTKSREFVKMTHLALRNKYVSSAARITAMVILVGFIVASFGVTALAVIHAGHDCVERLCSLCPCILGKRLTEQIGKIIAVVGILSAAVYVMRNFGEWFNLSRKYPVNLIESNVRMNN